MIGRPTKRRDTIPTNEIANKLARTGHTLEEIAEILTVHVRTLYRWLDDDPIFCQSIKDGKVVAIKRVENSLFHRGLGYSHPEEKIFCHDGEIIRTTTIKHYPPDTAAAFIWLKNVDPEHWRDKVDVEHSGDVILNYGHRNRLGDNGVSRYQPDQKN